MKFLGIRDGHDANLTYTDGTSVRYIKYERNYQDKHYSWKPNEPRHDLIPDMLEFAAKKFGFRLDEIDAIAMASDSAHHKLPRTIYINELYFEVDRSKHSLWSQVSCPVYQLDHHYSHIFSVWPLTDVSQVTHHFVCDGLGDHGRCSTFFERQSDGTHRIVEYVDRTENNGLSVTMERLGEQYGMHGSVLDMSGKLMALKSFHNLSDDFTRECMDIAHAFRYRHLNPFIQFANDIMTRAIPHLDTKQRLINLAYLLHVFAEEKMPDYFNLYADSSEVITYSGGTAQNTVVNTKLRERFPRIEIPPHCPDDGISLGCVEFLRQKYEQPLFDRSGFPFWQSDDAPSEVPSDATVARAAELLARGKIVGWYQGHGEVGPRALGNRSILMNPAIAGGKDLINNKVKHREPYRPFGASILHEYTSEYFDCDYESPYMLYVITCRRPDDFASIVHVDGTCRIQTVNQDSQYGTYRRVLEAFRELTGIPMLLNTSLNVDGKPIAATPDNAVTVFNNSEMDALVIGDMIGTK